MRFTFTTYIEAGEDEIELSVTYDVTPYVPARLYGDYPQPAEGGEVEVISVKHAGAEYRLTDEQEADLLRRCEERAGDDMEAEAADAAEWHAQSRRDALLMGDWT